MYDLIIIGSGPAGLSAAVYGIRAGLNLVVLEQNPMSGGQILNTYEVDNYLGLPGISGFDMGQTFRAHADKLGVTFVTARVKEIIDNGDSKVVRTRKQDYEARAVIVATGAEHAHLNVPGEEQFSGMGVSYCATCDGAFFKEKTVAVVGGGDVALEDAIYLARTSKKVYLLHRRDELRGAKVLQEELLALPNVEVLYSHVVKEIQGDQSVQRLLIQDVKTQEERGLAVDGVFIAVGIHPCSELIRDMAEHDEAGYILAGENCASSAPGIYVAGDIRKKPLRQVVTAVSDGANAAVAVSEFLRK
ncbi:MAG: thioredoxin-disulfide reductase [Lachnospiraceae bacterium]|nr:thioredoxin-disulfide reductase [Lachnospiraceae bacterium]